MVGTVFHNGTVFTADAARSWASAVAVVDERVVAVGGRSDVAPFVSAADDVVDLRGRALWPGFIDGHVHPVMGGLERARCDLSTDVTAEACANRVAAYASAYPERPWILGGGWSMASFPGGRPEGAALDVVVHDRPVFLPNRDHHSAWVNRRALDAAGIDAATPDPVDGRIERDESGQPTGLLHEGAMDLVGDQVPPDTQREFDDGLRAAQDYLHSLGVVGWQDAIVRVHEPGPTVHESYLRADADGWLTARVRGALWWDRGDDDVAGQVERLVGLRDQARTSPSYRAGSVKIMQDGVVETFTAALLAPYLDRDGHPGDNAGLSFLAPKLLAETTAALDREGFDIHFHALGDRAVREVLDALGAARAAHGVTGGRHQLAHLQVVHPDDLARFRSLGAVANLQCLWACHEPAMDDLSIPFLGAQRTTWQYPFGDLLRHGTTLAMGSDWPVSSPDPLAAIHVAVNRIEPGAPAGTPPLGPEQSLPLAVAVAAYTAGSAWVNRIDDRSGSIRVGQEADLVLLDRDPFSEPVDQIAAARVERTYVAGRLVYAAHV